MFDFLFKEKFLCEIFRNHKTMQKTKDDHYIWSNCCHKFFKISGFYYKNFTLEEILYKLKKDREQKNKWLSPKSNVKKRNIKWNSKV